MPVLYNKRVQKLTRQSWLYALIAAALFAQTAGSGALTALTGKTVDLAGLLCAPSGVVSEQARTAASKMLAALGVEQAPSTPPGSEHCPLCVSTSAAPLPVAAAALQPRYRFAGPIAVLRDVAFVTARPFALPAQRGPPPLRKATQP